MRGQHPSPAGERARTGEAHTATSSGEDLVATHMPTTPDHEMKAAARMYMPGQPNVREI